ncbi:MULTISPECIES: FG-GAP-like repeat-containing protein [unclassified Rhizobacter]|uniref:FG-GAP-like repeat-containing protein n=1 Tax=unclassified Rhizobacter TaxID=2640088 RepID=UPI0006F22F4D|nr:MULTISPECIES: FG-GAP-like repeat-containing protein [unclassified Rhizobacter]KQU77157.1 hypothetical protein ASC88_22545 [Rhizobacter sp. Root29]KQW12769.1 hypothetical protein ASC98_19535 [Rhizobacter sp. Root1238]KRB22357.1 hypothetical protein ASE08_21285 [Rhizobacter sp. Root16D2]
MFFAAAAAQSQVTVSNGGTASYEHAIAVPPGIGGLAPQLGLSYSSGDRHNGVVGYGWSLRGPSTITRCAAVRATDGVHVSVGYTANDKLCLDGERLIPLDASGNAVVGAGKGDAAGLSAGGYREYRTERDSYSRIRAYGMADGTNAASGPAWFRVWTKSGRIVDYGNNPQSSDANTNATIGAYYPPGQTVRYADLWASSRIADIFGNHVDFKYAQRDVTAGTQSSAYAKGHEWYLAEIQYSNNKVIFNYTDRVGGPLQDISEDLRGGVTKRISAQRLASITTYTNAPNTGSLGVTTGAVAIATTQLGYQPGPVTKRSRLAGIWTCAGDATSTKCLPLTQFRYSAGGNGEYQAANFNLASTVIFNTGRFDSPLGQRLPTGIFTADFNGDGRTDILHWESSPANNRLYFSNGDGSFSEAPLFNIKDRRLAGGGSECVRTILRDFDGDGLVDVLAYSDASGQQPAACGPATPSVLYKNRGDGSFDKQSLANVNLAIREAFDKEFVGGTIWGAGDMFYIVDVDGDGQLDFVTVHRDARDVDHRMDPLVDKPCDTVCTRVFRNEGANGFREIPTNISRLSLYPSNPAPMRDLVLDVDNDGLPDLFDARPWSGRTEVLRSRGDGNFDQILVAPSVIMDSLAIPFDYNGDGRTDLLMQGYQWPWLMVLGDVDKKLSTAAISSNPTSEGRPFIDMPARFGSGMVPMDMDGDGRQDILMLYVNGSSRTALYLSMGNGSFVESTDFNLTDVRLRPLDNSFLPLGSFVIGDFTGRGNAEFLRLTDSGNTLYVKKDPSPPDLLIGVTSDTGAATSLTYVPLSNPQLPGDPLGPRYASDLRTANAAALPRIDITPSSYVVATLQTDNGAGGTVKSEYSYQGLKADTTGRDALGFRVVRRQTVAPNGAPRTSEVVIAQDFPYIGLPLSTSVHRSALNSVSSSNLLSRTTSVYCDQTAAAGAEAAAIASGLPCTSSQVIKRPYTPRSRSTGVDLQGVALPTVIVQTAVNPNGDPMQTTTTTSLTNSPSNTYTQIATNQYWPDNTGCADTQTCAWILSRVKQNTERATSPGSILPTSAGTAQDATATAGTSAKPPVSPALISLILQLLLDD